MCVYVYILLTSNGTNVLSRTVTKTQNNTNESNINERLYFVTYAMGIIK